MAPLVDIVGAVATGKLNAAPDKVFNMGEVVMAHEYAESESVSISQIPCPSETAATPLIAFHEIRLHLGFLSVDMWESGLCCRLGATCRQRLNAVRNWGILL